MSFSQFFTDDKLAALDPAERLGARNRSLFESSADGWVASAAHVMAREAERNGYKLDPIAALKDPNFSVREAASQLREAKYRLSETVVTSMVGALTNVGMVAAAADAYKLVPTVYRQLARIVQSQRSEEQVFALGRGDIPVPVGETEDVPESRLGGILTRIKNYKFARIWSVSEDAQDDDQTGQLAQMGQMIGEGMGYSEEMWFFVCMFWALQAANIRPLSGAGNGIIPPMNIAGSSPTGYGGPVTAYGDITIANVENALEAFDYITDLEGNFALGEADSIVAASSRKFTLRKIFGSPTNPLGASAAGALGGQAMINPLYGALKIYTSPFIKFARAGFDGTNPPWAIGQAGKGMRFQDRTPLTVVREAPNSGAGFRNDTINTKAKRRFGAGMEAGEYWFAGN